MRFPATPGWVLPAAVVAVSAALGGGSPVLCVFVARRVLVCALCIRGGGVGVVWVCLPRVLVRVWRVAVGFPGWGLLLV